jgi:predicted RNase H-like HicB family nuclease
MPSKLRESGEHRMNNLYSMVIQWSDEDQTFVVSIPEFGPHSKTHGASYEEAAKNGQEVLELLIDTYKAEGWELPEPSKLGSPVPAA